eukprot:TRINITY_DN12413_c0_g1::TRINITY_DN12413_c0_g1_i1::g.4997::m.4997 TRINITY_DN12413_c0_g1::TRINITY_DN12413_c0_g1_i1::g.4997  ORF type:complete len:272 (+),score=16.87,sp/O28486/PNPH_ARCFU/34.15/3e-41,PNP_UDP_1/PF01048.15/2.1e-30 TRINITY_DN12413_c0_g1_i1:33-818(+)
MAEKLVAVIAGTSLRDSQLFSHLEKKIVTTPFGDVVVRISPESDSNRIVFVQRHHANPDEKYCPPHSINKRALFWALRDLQVHRIISICSVGSLHFEQIPPGSIILPDDFISLWDPVTCFDNCYSGHVLPGFAKDVRQYVVEKLHEAKMPHVLDRGAVYGQTKGPRFETPAEIRMMRTMGCDVVGMTGAHEVVLASELGMQCVMLCSVDNYANGIGPQELTIEEFKRMVAQNQTVVEMCTKVMIQAVSQLPPPPVTPLYEG